MPKTTPPFPPSFETDEELYALLQEGLDADPAESIVFGSEEWQRFRAELERPQRTEKLAS